MKQMLRLLAVVPVLWISVAQAQIEIDTRQLKLDPSDPASPEYRRTIEERNRRVREEAEKVGKTHIDTTYGPFGDAPAKPEGVKEGAESSDPQQVEQEVRSQPREARERPRRPVGGYERRDEVRQGELRELVGELLKVLDRGPEVVRLRAARAPQGAVAGADGAVRRTAVPAEGAVFPKIRPGAGFYARVLYAVNSDYPGPVLIELLEPPLRGAVVTGRFERVRERLVVRLDRMSWRGGDAPVEAWAVGLDCACYGLSGEVDRHWFQRLILPAAVQFAEGYLVAKGQGGRRVEVSGETVVDERDEPTDRQAVYSGLGRAARSAGEILLEDAPTGPTVRIPRNSDVAVVFARPLGEAASATGAPARDARGPPPGGVVRAVARPTPGDAVSRRE